MNRLFPRSCCSRRLRLLPAPGHHPARLPYCDRNTGVLFSGDYLLPGRLSVDDIKAYRSSAQRVADFARDRPVSAVLGILKRTWPASCRRGSPPSG